MKKLMNDPSHFVDEMLDGLTAAFPSLVRDGETRRVIRCAAGIRAGKVGVVSGGGSGHLPLFTGYVGRGLLDACSIGNVFEGPTVDSCIDAIKLANAGRGVLRLYGNYGGDRMNFDMAGELLEGEGIATTTVLGTDDIASAGLAEVGKRRGVAGIVYAYKAAGARAEDGGSLKAVTEMARHTVERTRTIGVALGPCQVPGTAQPSFTIGDDEIEMGMGIHGEPGIWRGKLRPADQVADEMLTRLLAEAPKGAKKASILVNSLGATPIEELLIIYRRAAAHLSSAGVEITLPLVGHYATSMEMSGVSISLCFLDPDIERMLRAPADCPFWRMR